MLELWGGGEGFDCCQRLSHVQSVILGKQMSNGSFQKKGETFFGRRKDIVDHVYVKTTMVREIREMGKARIIEEKDELKRNSNLVRRERLYD